MRHTTSWNVKHGRQITLRDIPADTTGVKRDGASNLRVANIPYHEAEMAPPGLPDRAARDRGRAALARGSAAPHLEQGPPGATSSGRGGGASTPPSASHSARASTSGSPPSWGGPCWSASSGETGSPRTTPRPRAAKNRPRSFSPFLLPG